LLVALRRSSDRLLGAAATASLLAILGQASIDWTWSFPALVAPTLLVVGAAAGTVRDPIRGRGVVSIALGVGTIAAFLLVASPYLATRHLEEAKALQDVDVAGAWDRAESARLLNPWNPDVLSLQGRLAEAVGRNRLAAERYGAAARLSRRPWLEHYYRARALERAGALDAARAACRRALAGNPADETLATGPCRGLNTRE
jgi:tetratricopeptide (TPR) repeat protein